jgi:hypothetical protein
VVGRERLEQLPAVPALIEAGYVMAGVMAWAASSPAPGRRSQ